MLIYVINLNSHKRIRTVSTPVEIVFHHVTREFKPGWGGGGLNYL